MRVFATAAFIASAMLLSGQAMAADKPPKSWDGLVQVQAKKLDLVYLQPGADFRTYTKVMIDPTEVAFQKNWQRDYNTTAGRSLGMRVSDRDIEETITKAAQVATKIFADAWTAGGYTVVDAPGPDVMRVKTGVVNIVVTAPDTQASMSYSASHDAGAATLFVEARDSMTGALLGRAIDQKVVGDSIATWRTSASNRGDFRDQVELWAKISVRGVTELKAMSPIAP